MSFRALTVAGVLCALALPAHAQVLDTAAIVQDVQRQLMTGQLSPEDILQRIRAAGLSTDDVRRMLREAGYPESLLDTYLGLTAAGAGAPSLSATQLEDILRRLSIPPTDRRRLADSLRMLSDRFGADTLLFDSVPRLPVEPRIFGKSLFERATSQFQPVTMGPVPANYRLGPGDELVLILTGDVQDVYTLPVTREGFIVIPDVGRVAVNGLTLKGLRNALYTHLGRVYSGVTRGPEATTFFEVSLSSLRRNQVYVIGEVERPAQYEVTSVSTAMDALYQAGGPTENGSFRSIKIRRGDRLVGSLDIYEYLTQGRASGDISLEQGDVVFVPVRGRRVQIDGNVVRPGVYELKGNEGLRALLGMAGGVEPEADLRRVQVDRVLPPAERRQGVHRTLFDLNVNELLDAEGELVPLEAGDRIYVFAVSEERRNTVTLRGNVWSPGVYEFAPGMRLSQLIDKAGGLRDDAYLGRAQIIRLDPADLSRRVLAVSLAAGDDPPLREFDEIVVYSASEFRDRRTLSIDGAVQNPGVYEYREGMTLRDLVLMAGGLRDDAYVEEAEVARLERRADRPGTLTDVIRVPIDSSYVVSEWPRGDGGGGSGANDGVKQGANNGANKGPEYRSAAPDFALERYDNVFIRRQPGWEFQRTVAITGEVRFPGQYSLERKDERLQDLIERAGGLTSEAYPAGIRFYRRREASPEDPRELLAQQDSLAESPIENSLRAEETAEVFGMFTRVNIDLVSVLEDDKNSANLILAHGDSIHIPEYIPTVEVDGAVLFPTSVLYKPGAGLDYYISSAGGYARDADENRTRVVYANGSVRTVGKFLVFKSSPTPDPGSRVFVPAKTAGGGIDLRAVAAVATAVATVYALVTRN